ncbi:hypothetical protein D3C73_851590 [compost metagenome]
MARGLPLRAQAGQRCLQRGGILVGIQGVVLRGRPQFIASLCIARHLAQQHHLLFGQRDPFGQGCRRDGAGDDIAGQRAPRRFQLEGLLLDLRRQRGVGKSRRAEQIQVIAGLDLAGEDVIERRRLGQVGHGQRAVARGAGAGVHGRQQRRIHLRAQLFARAGQVAFGCRQVGAVGQALLHQGIERIGAIAFPPFGHGPRALFKALRHALRGGALGGRGFHTVLGRRGHRGRLAVRRESAGAQCQQQGQNQG